MVITIQAQCGSTPVISCLRWQLLLVLLVHSVHLATVTSSHAVVTVQYDQCYSTI